MRASCLILVCLLGCCPPKAFADQVVLNEQAPVSTLSINELRAIYAMRMTHWPDGTRITVHVLEDQHPLHQRFCKNILGIFPYRLRKIWDRLVYSGTGSAPRQIDDEAAMLEAVRSSATAIGYLPEDIPNDGLKRVVIDD